MNRLQNGTGTIIFNKITECRTQTPWVLINRSRQKRYRNQLWCCNSEIIIPELTIRSLKNTDQILGN